MSTSVRVSPLTIVTEQPHPAFLTSYSDWIWTHARGKLSCLALRWVSIYFNITRRYKGSIRVILGTDVDWCHHPVRRFWEEVVNKYSSTKWLPTKEERIWGEKRKGKKFQNLLQGRVPGVQFPIWGMPKKTYKGGVYTYQGVYSKLFISKEGKWGGRCLDWVLVSGQISVQLIVRGRSKAMQSPSWILYRQYICRISTNDGNFASE